MQAFRITSICAASVGALFIAGCTSTLRVTYSSDPQGATLYQGDAPVGQTPYLLTYQPDETFKSGGCMRLNGTTARWASGASASVDHLTVCRSNGYSQVYGFRRPDVAGREIDANYALQLQQTAIMQQTANAQSRAAAAQSQAAAAQMYRALNPPPPVFIAPAPVYIAPAPTLSAPVNCTSQRIFNTVNTQCY